MEMLIKEIKAISWDIGDLIHKTHCYKKDAERSLRNAHVADEEGVPIRKQNEMLTSDLADAMYDLDRTVEKLKEIEEYLDKLIEVAEYENLSQAVWSK
jgi:hypothetical protein